MWLYHCIVVANLSDCLSYGVLDEKAGNSALIDPSSVLTGVARVPCHEVPNVWGYRGVLLQKLTT